ncbi:hypothetical protein [Synechococcus sp. A15-60]|uniref:hypothetical protein n=1 Tax=Synechococcus sp. A15-60 TaxID=1050655 RepID=UPI0018623E08|nr:hypothetical protein [Synechococcus sp. A15-60]QNI49078.1 hypothetical protein SynA1560_02435 [Synechococcus sp. A15-60]
MRLHHLFSDGACVGKQLMKFIPAIAALTLIAAPAQAFTDAQNDKMLSLVKQATEAVKSRDFATACTNYRDYVIYRITSGHTEFREVTGTQQQRNVLVRLNDLTASLNEPANKDGRKVCEHAGMNWGIAPLPEQPSGSVIRINSSSVSQNIRERCERKWGTDYEMVR